VKEILLGSRSPLLWLPPWSFNWYQSGLDHLLFLTDFVTRRRHGERCHEAQCLQLQGFWLLEEPNKELLVEPGMCYLGDCTNKVRDLDNALECNPR
jgi:hypothetical protein